MNNVSVIVINHKTNILYKGLDQINNDSFNAINHKINTRLIMMHHKIIAITLDCISI